MYRTIRVFIVDDHDILRHGLKLALSVFDDIAVVGEAEEGQRAVELCRELKPDVVLMDLVMPGDIDGIAATQMIRSQQPATQVVVLTSFDERALVQDAIKAGAISYLLKNVAVEELISAIRNAFAEKATLSREIAAALINTIRETPPPEFFITEREKEVLAYLVKGLSNAEIAQNLTVSTATAKKHVANILEKLNATNRTEAVSLAIQHKLVSL